MPKKSPWKTTSDACEELGLTTRQLWKLREDMTIGKHYRTISRATAKRPTYQWHIGNIATLLQTPLENR
ncbi:hypothetical protein [Pseudanabaena sp. PCC 6802]|uniref:hypothetical protein n=1 Tax=Pseudanabaena sp. PCC 6802 TaxID=118173 RepID=UPI00034C47BD|nr:hypothetical protein [Pseudanabaena sp. PCC 6802]